MAEINIDLNQLRKNGIFLMVPAYAGQCFAAFARSCMGLSAMCAQHGIPFEVFFIYNESLITRARNYCADVFVNRKFRLQDQSGNITEHYFQHGIFIDSDIEFEPIDVLVLAHLQASNPQYNVIAGPYPKKVISYEKIKYAVEKGLADEDPNDLEKYVGDFVFNALEGYIKINEPAEVSEAGTGFMMIHRNTLIELEKKFPDIKYRPDHARTEGFDGTREISSFFDTSIDPVSRRYLSEDYHFCHLVRNAGMKVWLVPWFKLKHHGFFIFSGSLPDMAAAGISATVDEKMLKKNRAKKKKK